MIYSFQDMQTDFADKSPFGIGRLFCSISNSTCRSFLLVALILSLLFSARSFGAGVTVITHGLNGNADGWVTGMANQIPNNSSFPGTGSTFYKIYFYNSGGSYFATWSRLGGSAPTGTDSGEIVVAFDWSQLADGNSYNTYQIASVLSSVLQSSNFISELNGHALAELPLHLIGHSRGGSLMCETSRLLGTNGCWVDHLTTLDPHPLNNDGFFDFIYSAVDAPARTYVNVLFHDNYWQNIAFLVYGEPVSGAYVRQLFNVPGGYSSEHSDVHLWYHGTVDERNPASDTEAQLTSAEFASWYTAYENYGYNAGFRWSLIGGGNRTSFDLPQGIGYPAVRDGYNQAWSLGAGSPQNPNRTSLTSNNGKWPNVMRLNLVSTNKAQQGTSALFSLYFQWAQPAASNATIRIYLDDDFNPFNGNSHQVQQVNVAGTGTAGTSISYWDSFSPLVAPLNESNAPAGFHSVYASISGGGRTRYLYAPEIIQILSAPPPILLSTLSGTNIVISWSTNSTGFTLQSTTNFASWISNPPPPVVSGGSYVVTNPVAGGVKFYRLKK